MTRPYNGEKEVKVKIMAFGFLILPNHMRECLHETPKVKVSSFQLLYTHYHSPLSTLMSKPITLLKWQPFPWPEDETFTLHLFSSKQSQLIRIPCFMSWTQFIFGISISHAFCKAGFLLFSHFDNGVCKWD